ncbi:pyridoxamine 5'-phosphate oxidase [Rhodovulum bhavnagarense]|uniref:Pyridoxamine 5'-phosphate oxidase n=1 Tax=Rhodovulum bhavnagarense TaxID=992286 RepID=A0A4R2RFD6_9RHOB|nr:pyridoxamine 5'-phosphate oxidase family protein [Rhodovulum bhavnagarense]TCP62302.1 pyridoxamine 5'-phosphate oxidase [Rhodovulum bhavnagarense]
MNDFNTLPGVLDLVWQRLSDGILDRHAAARTPVLATRGAAGAEARMVVLRAADRTAGHVDIHSDLRAAKVAELRAEPHAALLVWDGLALLQIRLRARFEVLSGPAVEPDWQASAPSSRTLYGGSPAPGAPLPHPSDHAPGPDRAAFAVLRGWLTEIETLHLRPDHHRRALFRAADGWAGSWRAP